MTAKRQARPRAVTKPTAPRGPRAAAAEGGGRLSAIEHIVIVMMENRSFDHMLGYLNIPPWNAMRPPVDGVSLDPAWIARYTNMLDGQPFAPHDFSDRRIDDPPHTRPNITMQLGTSAGAAGSMTGFVASYAQRKRRPRSRSHVMGYYTAPDVPVFDFFARNFTVCDRWFSALPAGTQPNRLMALAGSSKVGDNAPLYLPDQDLVYDWLTQRGIRWRVYHDGIVPFVGLMRKWMQTIDEDNHKSLSEDPRFRWLDPLENDLKQPHPLPPVVFIEPDYTDIPIGHSAPPNDDHPPSSIDFGQRFLARVYRALSANPAIWSKCAMIITYDEHGGFFDHVDPPAIPTVPAGPYDPFSTLGVRVPSFVISPFVEAGTVSHGLFDHTSILQLLSERFADGSYSADVDRRHQGAPSLDRLSNILTRDTARTDVPPPPEVISAHEMSENETAFHEAVTAIRERSPDSIAAYLRTDIQGP
jgi:phospholipase C